MANPIRSYVPIGQYSRAEVGPNLNGFISVRNVGLPLVLVSVGIEERETMNELSDCARVDTEAKVG